VKKTMSVGSPVGHRNTEEKERGERRVIVACLRLVAVLLLLVLVVVVSGGGRARSLAYTRLDRSIEDR